MDALSGKNSTGRKVSLLNDGPPPTPQLVRLPSITPSLPSSSHPSSYTTSPLASPLTPRLVRSDSSESTAMATPSPITPDFAFTLPTHTLHSPVFSHNVFFSQPKPLDADYPPLAHPADPLAYHPIHPAAAAQLPDHPHTLDDPPATTTTAAAAAAQRPKKNSYPCPMAKQYACNDYFTTSGHAARHAKKHTGKKDAYCPECNKAFTRKDNMEQHRRTHQGLRATKTGERDGKKARPAAPAKRPKISPLQQHRAPTPLPSAAVDPSLPLSPTSHLIMAPAAVHPSDAYLDFSHRSHYPDPTAYSMTHTYPAASYSGGLDALAAAASASGEKRKYTS